MDDEFRSKVDFDATNMAMTRYYNDEQTKILNRIPKQIGYRKDVYQVKTTSREKPKGATKIYSMIKKNFLFKLDQIEQESTKNIKRFNKKIIEYLLEKESRNDIKTTITTTRKSREKVHEIVILYDKFTWFKDSNLLSTIRFHEKLNEIFMARAEESLKYDIDKSKIEDIVNELVKHPDYIKAVIIVTFQPVLSYGAIFASIRNDYEYIIKYESLVSEAAEVLFNSNPTLKMQFFQ